MTTLHTINRSPTSTLLSQCLAALQSGDGLLFIEDGVYHLQASTEALGLPAGVDCYGLREDCVARGITERCAEAHKLIGFADFVALCCTHDRVINWF